VLRFLLVVLGFGIVPPYVSALFLLWKGARRPLSRGRFDAGIVLGCAVLADGSPSRALAARAETAGRLFLGGMVDRLVLSGGFSPGRPSEASAMREVLRRQGIPGAQCSLEENSHSTYENLRYSWHLLVPTRPARVLVITERYHLWRALHIARRLGLPAEGYGAPSPDRSLWGWAKILFRECTSILWFSVR
jgi:uncharacterized SAM-binding protein YcdF (DUF218 family)